MKEKNERKHRIATFNCQGLVTSDAKKRLLADDFEEYQLTMMAVQETHMKGTGLITLKSSSNKQFLPDF